MSGKDNDKPFFKCGVAGCGASFDTLEELLKHIWDNHQPKRD